MEHPDPALSQNDTNAWNFSQWRSWEKEGASDVADQGGRV